MTVSNADIEDCVLMLLGQRAATSSICPSEVARSLADQADEWRALMPRVRDVAGRLASQDTISITQGDVTLDPAHIDHGPIRLRRGPKFPTST